jgi:hypothetical protein
MHAAEPASATVITAHLALKKLALKRESGSTTHSRTLLAIIDNVNQSRGDRDPAVGLPRRGVVRDRGF